MARPELHAAYWSISGDCYASGPTEVSPFDFRERVEVAGKVGYKGVGFVHQDLMAVADRIGWKTMKQILDDNGMKYVEVEIIGDWFTDGAKRKASDIIRKDLLNAAEKLGAWHIKIGGDIENDGAYPWPMDKMVAELKVLADQAAGVGTKLALEIMPFSNFKTIDQAVELMQGAGKKNAGIMLDIWHVARGNIPFGEILKMPKELLFWVEIDDARKDVEGSLYNDTVHNRELPGEGDLDIQEFLRAVRDIGYTGPYGVEIISYEHRVRSLQDQAQIVYDTAMAQFDTLDKGK
ncbi:MAG: sugar phosphate isomerase/epimerase family protein [Bauldia sp.]